VDVFRQHPGEIGLVVCDVTMPFMDGWQTLAALRQLVPGIPAILSSGYTDALVMGANRSEQPQAFLSKPYELKDLLEAMDQALRDRQAATVSRDPPSAGRTQ
jgi:CheY-like chemotaxis protein